MFAEYGKGKEGKRKEKKVHHMVITM